MKNPNPKHSSKSNLWYTPLWLIEKSRAVLGGTIDFDPASDAFGNSRLGATKYWSERALERTCPKVDTLFLNPPGGKLGNQSQPALFWAWLMSAWAHDRFKNAIFVGFSIEIMQTSQQVCVVPPQAHSFCVPKSRISFDDAKGVPGVQPAHASVIVHVGSEHKTFAEMFENVGWVN